MAVVTVPVWYHVRGWIMVPITVCGIWHADFILNTFRFHSTVSAATATVLDGFECLGRGSGTGYLLQDVIVGGAPIPNIAVRISAAATILGVEGMLGLDFLNQFARIGFDVNEGVLTLELR